MARRPPSSGSDALIPVERIERQILVLRGHKVMLDRDLADAYGVQVKALNQAVKRNAERFPADFMFRLTPSEKTEVVTNCDHLQSLKFSPTLPFAFTEHGAVMVASILNSPTAVRASIAVVRAFVRLRQLLADSDQLRGKLDEVEARLTDHDEKIAFAFEAIRQLMDDDEKRTRRPPIGYHTEARGKRRK